MYIYKTVCLTNGKIYIGQCCKTPENSSGYLGSGVSISNAIKRYGKQNFVKEVLVRDVPGQKQLDILEQIYIKRFNACDRSVGYNILPGSANGFRENPARLEHAKEAVRESNRRRIWSEEGKARATAHLKNQKSEEHKKNISLALIGKSLSDETKQKIAEFAKTRVGEKNGMFGRKQSEEAKIKMAEALMKYRQSRAKQ